jgi:ubiquinone/menaquinone biosynthesis C-methylase UbiE
MPTLHVEAAVKDAYAAGAASRVDELCCPVDYDPRFLEAIPDEVIERDYGCGDPSKYLCEGETVLDLGSGTGKICFIASQVVGPEGRVIGVDMTPEMLDVARRNAPVVASNTGFANVEFRRARIQDLALDLDRLEQAIVGSPIRDVEGLFAMQARAEDLRRAEPMIETESIDVVVSNCVLNLVDGGEKPRLFAEIFRVLRNGGRAVISDIVSDEEVPDAMQNDPELWSGCVSGALTETAFLDAFADAGFYGVTVLDRQSEPWRTVDGIEFRSVTVEAFKGKEGPCLERKQAVIYRGPFREVLDDDGHRLLRGQRTAVCDKTYTIYGRAPYAEYFDFVDPVETIPLEDAEEFDCMRAVPRHPRETKGMDYDVTTEAGPVCGPEGCC